MTEQFDAALKAATTKGTSLCLSVLDVNGFKKLNDKYGHMFGGDEVLRHIGKVIRERLTDGGDSAIRYGGGDEFILLLTCPKSGNNLTQKLHQIVDAVTEPITIESVDLNLSISFGNALYPKDGTTSDDLFKVADSRMYAQKRSTVR